MVGNIGKKNPKTSVAQCVHFGLPQADSTRMWHSFSLAGKRQGLSPKSSVETVFENAAVGFGEAGDVLTRGLDFASYAG